jgi:hypothetical protein
MNEHLDAFIALWGRIVAQIGGWGAVISWLLSEKGIALIGVGIGLAGLALQFYFQRKRDKREQAEHELRMGLMG